MPYKQDLRVARTTCGLCGKTNPPWGHVNRFDEVRLQSLFSEFFIEKVSYVGKTDEITNCMSLMVLSN